ncbi:DNA segregation ATPase FtsK/SpoIIIE, S-DNA-T family [Saccharopolyspora kobensis]|uniref:DNA segregation ATPase FtsK/SpoIIIE, S-DNA-T family n=1 Tax=Saccharopolyspora kobensis TaxID=146035 RepID=A0A1H6DZ35_9PSEU|nr:FtsK/SpoIIIE domain-containing protein [Saccharopolyspora kobensis]SEG90588.1 DNA segregation ATPase FtsK/SpoIIIE, S-DNA-T family [Saccharopolyspora kobensis]SFD92311.1 DNA segregation ATPase FtsK/SpoIIIE, S-DNA-T family [Saccharopolyspora kobensis]
MGNTLVGAENTSPIRWGIRQVASHPRSSGSAAVGSAAVFWFGLNTMLWAVGIAVLAGVSWRLLDRPTFDRFAGRLLRAWWRRWWTYQRQWLRIMTACNLTTTDHKGNTLMPRVTRVKSTWSWDTVTVRMAKGQEPEDFEKVINRLANAFRARSTNVRLVKPGKLALDFQRCEPFDEMVIPLPALAESTSAVDLRRLPVGFDEYGREFSLNLLERDLHVLLGGATGAGKGSWLWSLLRSLAPLIRAGLVRLWVIDPKGGQEFGMGREMFHEFADNDVDGLKLMQKYVKTLDERKLELGRAGVRTFTPSRETPLELLICDELAAMTSYGGKAVTVPFEPLISKGLTQYRSVGGRIVCATQEPTKEHVPMRGLFPTKIALRLDSASYVDMCLGEGMRDMGAFADKIPEILAGVAYAKRDGKREPLRVRAPYSSDTDVAELVAFCTALGTVTELRTETDPAGEPELDMPADIYSFDFEALEVDDEDDESDEDDGIEYIDADEIEDEEDIA